MALCINGCNSPDALTPCHQSAGMFLSHHVEARNIASNSKGALVGPNANTMHTNRYVDNYAILYITQTETHTTSCMTHMFAMVLAKKSVSTPT